MLNYNEHSINENVNTNYKNKFINLFDKFINNEDVYSDKEFISDLSELLYNIRSENNDYSLIVVIKFYKSDIRNYTIDDIIDMLTSSSNTYDSIVYDIYLATKTPGNVKIILKTP